MKICAILNISPLYREAIYALMDNQLDVDFIFGDRPSENIAMMNPAKLSGFRGYAHNIYQGTKLIWQRGTIRRAIFHPYDAYILTGNTGILSNWVIMLISRIIGRKTYLWTHGLYGSETRCKLVKNRLYLQLSGGLLCYNARGAQLAIQQGVKASKVHVIYNSLDYPAQVSMRAKVGDKSFIRNYFGNDNPYVCYVGRLTEVKKIDQLFEAGKSGAFNIIIVGDGPQRDALEKLCAELEIADRCWFYGECYDQQMLATLISNATACVSPGNAGLNVIHSLTYGTPLVTHENLCDQMPETEAIVELQSKTGVKMLFSQNDTTDLAQTLQNIISLPKDKLQNIKSEAMAIIDNKWNPTNQIKILHDIGM